MPKGLGRRTAIAGGAALATASLIRPRGAYAAKALTVVLESEVTILDPHVITATITWTFGLRDGLKWHDGDAVTAEDCVASLKRWSMRDPLGKMLMADTASLEAADHKTIKLVLKQ